MRDWFERFSTREQMSLLGMALALFAFLVYQLAWRPLHLRADELQARNLATAEVLARVDRMTAEILALRAAGERRPRISSLTSLVNGTSQESGLVIARLQPGSRGDLQVRLESAAFDDLMRWLERLETAYGVLVSEVSLAETGSGGRVNATLRLVASG